MVHWHLSMMCIFRFSLCALHIVQPLAGRGHMQSIMSFKVWAQMASRLPVSDILVWLFYVQLQHFDLTHTFLDNQNSHQLKDLFRCNQLAAVNSFTWLVDHTIMGE